MLKTDVDQPFTEYFPGINIVGLPRSYRYRADLLQLTCTDKKISTLKWEHYDSKYNLMLISLLHNPTPQVAVQGSPFELLIAANCGVPVPTVQGTYEGTNSFTYATKGHGEEKKSLVVEQMDSELNVTFTTVGGGQAKGTGKLTKGDRLPLVPTFHFDSDKRSQQNTPPAAVARELPDGCESAVSPIVDQHLARIASRCVS